MKFIDTTLAFTAYFKCSKCLPSTFSSSKCSWNTCAYRLTNMSIIIKIIMCTNFLLLNIECQVTFAPPAIIVAQNLQWPGLNYNQPDVSAAKMPQRISSQVGSSDAEIKYKLFWYPPPPKSACRLNYFGRNDYLPTTASRQAGRLGKGARCEMRCAQRGEEGAGLLWNETRIQEGRGARCCIAACGFYTF